MIARSVATVACLICLTVFVGRASAQSSVDVPAGMQLAFSLGVERVIAQRRVNDANGFTCTNFFAEFERAKDIGPIVEFFRSKGIEPIRLQQNRHFFTYFELPSATLVSLGFPPLRPDDRLIFLFNTDAPPSSTISFFSAQVIGRTMP
jgi:hypothetical protein